MSNSAIKKFLNKKLQEGTTSKFLLAMHERINNKQNLTENMLKALNDAMSREQANTSTEKDKKTFKMSKWWMRVNGFHSLVITAEVEIETAKAYKIKGHADIQEGCWCMRCARPLTQPASFTIGYGAECASKIGVPYPAELNKMSRDDIDAYREKVLGLLKEQTFEGWIPKSQIAEVLA
jgi:hypothetical protein